MSVNTAAVIGNIDVDIPPYLDARLVEIDGRVLLVVHRSSLIETDGFIYQPVADFLAIHTYRELSSTEVDDPDMFGGVAIHTLYLLGGEQPSGLAA